jgi:hypothetical protein
MNQAFFVVLLSLELPKGLIEIFIVGYEDGVFAKQERRFYI